MSIDFTRVAGTIDPDIMQNSEIGIVGCGGGSRMAELLAHTPIKRLVLIDYDEVEARNPATQGHRFADVGLMKTVATQAAIREINPDTNVFALSAPWAHAAETYGKLLQKLDCLIIATDDAQVNRDARRFAIRHGIDAVDAQIYPGAACVEHVVTWPDVIAAGGGCGTCHTKGRLDAYEAGFVPPRDIPTNIFGSELSCVQTALIVTARLHQRAASTLPIVGIAEAFQRRPFHLTRLLPSFWADAGEPFADAPADGEAFFSRGFALDTPPGWVCPDCGCTRSAAP